MAAAVRTEFASAERSPEAEIERQRSYFGGQRLPKEILEFIPNPIMVLNQNRQIVYANPAARKLANGLGAGTLAGLRPGEALGCQHARQSPGRCGTTKFCRYCGNTRAILQSQSGRDAVEECRITVQHGETEEALDLRVWAHPTEWNHERFTVLALTDIADEKRRAFLEKIFLHDIMNSAMALHGFCQLLENGAATDSREHFIERMAYLSGRIMDEILAQRQLRAAESGNLHLNLTRQRSDAFLRTLLDCFNRADYLKGRTIQISEVSHDVEFRTDPALLGRVLGNMIKNAIEATGAGKTVKMGCLTGDGRVSFWVHNQEHMSEEIQLQIFKRSFSTKEPGRGLGTYSMKYLSEKYLGGNISFTSTKEEGTTVIASYPIGGPERDDARR